MAGLTKISTHVLDLMRGRPANDVPVRLEHEESGSWHVLASAHTDGDGRCRQLLTRDELSPGVYRLCFDTASYFRSQNLRSLYPTIEVVFEVREGESQFHIPLLLNANGYITYRGS